MHPTHIRFWRAHRGLIALGVAMVTAVAAATLVWQPAGAAGAVSQATAQAVDINVAGVSIQLSAAPTAATNDGTQGTITNLGSPAITALTGENFLAAGALSETATAIQDGTSYACAGVVQPGGAVTVGAGGTSCTNSGAGAGGLSLDLGNLLGLLPAGNVLSTVADVAITADAVTAFAHEDSTGTATGTAVLANPNAVITVVGGLLGTITVPITVGGAPNEDLLSALASSITAFVGANPGDAELLPVATALSTTVAPILSLTTNYQTTTPATAFQDTALHIVAIGGLGTIDLATATVGPNTAPLAVPTVASLSPASGPTGGGTSVTITGTGFTPDATVSVAGGPPITPTSVTATTVSFDTPPGTEGPATVSVTTSGGTSNAGTFTYVAAPTVTAMNPMSGPTGGGTSVTITGTGFTPDATVSVAGGPPITPTSVTPTSLTFDTPAGAAGPATVTVTTPGGTTAAPSFTYDAVPTISGLAPPNGPVAGNTTVVIGGTGLTSDTTVSVAGGPPITPSAVDGTGTTLAFLTPPGVVGPATVTVTNPGGTSNAATFTYLPVPVITALSPSSGPAAGGTSVTVTGVGFSPETQVNIAGAAPIVTVVNDTTLTFTTPAGAAGPADVVVFTPGGISNAFPFTYLAAPTLTGLSPSSGPTAGGTPVTVNGAGFTADSTVSVAGGPAITPTSVAADGTSLVFSTPAGTAGPATVTVTTPGGTSEAATFTYDAVPTVTGLSPVAGPTTGGTTVTITGTGFAPDSTVSVGGGAAITPISVAADGTSLVFSTPAGTAGPATVTVTTPGGTSNGSTFTYEIPVTLSAPAITSPTNGTTTTTDTPTIGGTGTSGAFVTVSEGTQTICTAAVAPNGTWSCTPSSALAVGAHTISAAQTMGALTSPVSESATFTVASPPAPPANTAASSVPASSATSSQGLASTGSRVLQPLAAALALLAGGLLILLLGSRGRRITRR